MRVARVLLSVLIGLGFFVIQSSYASGFAETASKVLEYATKHSDSVSAVADVINANETKKQVENDVSSGKISAKEGYTKLAENAAKTVVSTVGDIVSSHGEVLLEQGKKMNDASEKLKSIITQIQKTLNKTNLGGNGLKTIQKLQGEMRAIESESMYIASKGIKFANKAKVFKAAGTTIGGAVNAYDFIEKFKKFNKKENKSMMNGIILGKDAIVAVMGTLNPLVGLTDMATDFAKEKTNGILDAWRDTNDKIASAMFNLKMSYNKQLYRTIKRETEKKGRLLTKQEIKTIYNKNKINLLKALNGWKKHVYQSNSIGDGDVGIKAYKNVSEYANRLYSSKESSTDLDRLEKASARYTVGYLAKQAMAKAKEIIKSTNTIEEKSRKFNQKIASISKSSLPTPPKVDTKTAKNEKNKTEKKAKIVKNDSQKKILNLQSKEKEAKVLKSLNAKLSKEFVDLSVKAKLDPENKSLQQQLQTKKRELGNNAYKFLQLKKEILNMGGTNPGSINGYASNSVLASIDTRVKALQEPLSSITQKKSAQNTQKQTTYTKLPAIALKNSKTINARTYSYLLVAKKLVEKYGSTPFQKWSGKDRVKMKIIARNLHIKFGGSDLDKKVGYLLFHIKHGTYTTLLENSTQPKYTKNTNKQETKSTKPLKSVKTVETNHYKQVIAKKTKELENAKRRLADTSRYTYTSTRKQKKTINRSKLKSLIRAKYLVQHYGNTPLSKWKKSDMVKLGIMAHNIGISHGSIRVRAAVLRAQLKKGMFSYLKNKYATNISYYTYSTKHYNYDYTKLKMDIAHLTSVIKYFKRMSSSSNQNIQNSFINNHALSTKEISQNSDFNNNKKEEMAYKEKIAHNGISSTPGETETHITNTNDGWWDGEYVRNYYYIDNSGNPVLYGFGDGPVEATDNLKPIKGSTLHFYKSGDGTGTDRTRVLNNNTSSYYGNYNYVAWGTWSDPNADNSPDKNKIYYSNWEITKIISKKEIPLQGSGIYHGEIKGYLWKMGVANSVHEANGYINIYTDFANKEAGGDMLVKNADTGATWASADFSTNLQSHSDEDGLYFFTNLTGSDISNQKNFYSKINGDFTGDQASEIGGSWSITKGSGSTGDGRATGVFRTQRTASLQDTWLGYITYNSEDKSDGKLRYSGGNFGDTIDEISTGGGVMFNPENGYKVTNGVIKSIFFEHGENTTNDNTKQFRIQSNEIDKTLSSYNNNIKTLNLTKNFSNGDKFTIKSDGSYDYTVWGEWEQTGGLHTDINGAKDIEQMALHNRWIVGKRTKDLPTQGSATYNGVVNGHYYKGSIGYSYGGRISGTMKMKVDFANTSVVSGVLNLKNERGDSFATAHMSNMQINRAESGFGGRLTGSDVASRNDNSQNMISGQFNGPHAEEVGGVWNVTNKNNQFASGTFAATSVGANP